MNALASRHTAKRRNWFRLFFSSFVQSVAFHEFDARPISSLDDNCISFWLSYRLFLYRFVSEEIYIGSRFTTRDFHSSRARSKWITHSKAFFLLTRQRRCAREILQLAFYIASFGHDSFIWLNPKDGVLSCDEHTVLIAFAFASNPLRLFCLFNRLIIFFVHDQPSVRVRVVCAHPIR